MERSLAAMAQETYDVLVIGGGINGTAVAKDAALRGFKVALVEKEDFSYGTTSRSTRLIHGGLRYLELYDFALVREGLREREILLRLAPHLVEPLPFVFPLYAGDRRGPLMVKMGMILYDWLSGRKSVPSHRFLTRNEALAAEPLLNPDGLRGAMVYYDAQVPFPERMCLENALTAASAGAALANHAEVVELRMAGARVEGAVVRDGLTNQTHTIRARVVVNATGPWADFLNRAAIPDYRPHLRLTKGIHLVVPKFTERAVVLSAQQDGRIFFVIPWGEYSLVGTTDTDFDGDLDSVAADAEDVEYLVRETKKVFPEADLSTIYYTMAGVRPLALDLKKGRQGHASATSRMHAIVDHGRDGVGGLITVLGGKITNHRLVGEETVDLLCDKLGRRVPCSTHRLPYYGGHLPDGVSAFADRLRAQFASLSLSEAQVHHLVRLYGTAAEQVLRLAARDQTLAQPLVPDGEEILAQVVYAVEQEMARSTSDVLLRRCGSGLRADQAVVAAEKVARLVGRTLGWDEAAIRRDVEHYLDAIALMRDAWRSRQAAEVGA